MTKIEQAIEESIQRDIIVHIFVTPEEKAHLSGESDDNVENGPVTEFWGDDEDGNTWRIHTTDEYAEVTA